MFSISCSICKCWIIFKILLKFNCKSITCSFFKIIYTSIKCRSISFFPISFNPTVGTPPSGNIILNSMFIIVVLVSVLFQNQQTQQFCSINLNFISTCNFSCCFNTFNLTPVVSSIFYLNQLLILHFLLYYIQSSRYLIKHFFCSFCYLIYISWRNSSSIISTNCTFCNFNSFSVICIFLLYLLNL